VNAYLKAIMAVVGAIVTSLGVYYGGSHWYPIVTTALTALTVYLVPNEPNTPGEPTQPMEPAVKDPRDNPFGSGS
jgi:hypothetical protein